MLGLVSRMLGVMALAAVGCAEAAAQDALMSSAPTVGKGIAELGVFGSVLRPWYGDSNRLGMAGRLGIGVLSRLDVEIRGADFEHVAYVGGDAKLWLVRGQGVDVSALVGLDRTLQKGWPDISGFDQAVLVSGHATSRLEFYGGLKVRFESLEGFHDTVVHLVPGLEYRLADAVDFVAEAGLPMNIDSRGYVSVGLAFHPR